MYPMDLCDPQKRVRTRKRTRELELQQQHQPEQLQKKRSQKQLTERSKSSEGQQVNRVDEVDAAPQALEIAEEREQASEVSGGTTEDAIVRADIESFNKNFPSLKDHFQLLDKIGEGTFSTVYKAIDLRQDEYDNSNWSNILSQNDENERKLVAVKRIYVTSSPQRIANEISVLHDLSGHESIVPLITACRYEDQVAVVLPYFKHDDFRDYYLRFTEEDIRYYFLCLFNALAHTHSKRIIHRDVKPSNFLYDPKTRKGVLVDFGLAEREDDRMVPSKPVQKKSKLSNTMTSNIKKRRCGRNGDTAQKENGNIIPPALDHQQPGILKNDTRPSVRASRAGTRGFRAPEVLFKVVRQSVAIDIWSAGVILLCVLTGRFPFFNSNDDIEAIGELTALFGRTEMANFAAKQERLFYTNITSYQFNESRLERYAEYFTSQAGKPKMTCSAFDLLCRCITLDPLERISAKEALIHPFLTGEEMPADAIERSRRRRDNLEFLI